MKRLLNSPGVLAAAWFVVVAVVAGAAALAFLQPPPSGGAAAVVVALAPAAPPTQSTAEDAAPEAPSIPEPPAEPMQVELPSQDPAAPTASSEAAPATTTTEPPAAAPAEAEPVGPDATATAAAEEAQPAPEAHIPTQEVPAQEAPVQQTPADEPPVQEALTRIPVIPPAPEQLAPWQRYSQPFNAEDKRPRIAVVLTGLGLSDSATKAAIEQLPPAVTLSFSPYARGLEQWIALARARGHEVMLDLPMEPATFPNEDPGPQALLTSLAPETNLDRLDWVLSRGSAYVGVAGSMGSRFTATREAVEPVLQAVKERGLLFLDRRTTEETLVPALAEEIGLPYAVNNRTVDERQASRVAIDARLAQVERVALTSGSAVAMAQPYPVSIERLAEWAADLPARGFAVAPITALVDRPDAP